MGRKTSTDTDSCYLQCCVCMHKTSRNYTQLTQLYRKKKNGNNFDDEESPTLFDILENLQLLNYEVCKIKNYQLKE